MTVPVLVVDPDADLCRMVAMKLRAAGMTARMCADAEQAVPLLAAEALAAVVVDVSAPGARGLDVCRMIRRTPAFAMLPVLALTTRGRSEEVAGAMRAGATGYLVKPFSPAELTARLLALVLPSPAA